MSHFPHRFLLAVVALISYPNPSAHCEVSPHTTLSLDDVLSGVQQSYPKLIALREKRSAARAQQRSARGLWDPKLKLKGASSVLKGERVEVALAELRQATPLWGAELYAGYRLGLGAFPTYKGDYETLSGGELRAGLELPLLAGRSTDPARAELIRSAAREGVADERLRLGLIEAERYATEAYWEWIKASQLLKIQQELFTMAQGRAEGLKAQVEHGSKPPITLVDNERLILERSAEVVSARRALSEAAYKLSLFYRSHDDLSPIYPDAGLAPATLTRPQRPQLPSVEEDEVELIERHPLLRAQRKELEVAGVDLELADALLAPSLNVSSFVARDIEGVAGESASKLAKVELGVGLTFELPIGLNKASGKRAEAFAKRATLEAELGGLRDALMATIRQARVELMADYEQAGLAHRQVQVARKLVEGEQLKLEEGASDLIVLNLRELAYAKAEASEVKVITAYHKAWARYLSAKGQRVSRASSPDDPKANIR